MLSVAILFTILSSNQLFSCGGFNGQNVRHFDGSTVLIKDNSVTVNVSSVSVQFFVLGDWGGLPVYPYRTVIEQAVSNQMTRMAQIYNTQFQLALGDNFYFHGVKSAIDKRFKETYEDVFNNKYLNNPWFLLLGNHDHYGNASAQIEYTKTSKRWILPDFNYTINVTVNEESESLISILMIDTVLLCGNSGYDFEDSEPGYASKADKLMADNLFADLEAKLKQIAETGVKYIIVAGHFPVWSIAKHGPTQCLVNNLRPLLHKYGVSAYFCGHDHNLQHISDTFMDTTVEYVLSGAANFNDNSTDHINDIPIGALKFQWTSDEPLLFGGMVVVSADKTNMTVTYFESTGKELYQTHILPRRK